MEIFFSPGCKDVYGRCNPVKRYICVYVVRDYDFYPVNSPGYTAQNRATDHALRYTTFKNPHHDRHEHRRRISPSRPHLQISIDSGSRDGDWPDMPCADNLESAVGDH